MIKLDDTNGQLRKECQKLKMELEQSIAENNLFGSLNSEMKKLMSSMLDYCKQHESDIKRYKRKHEEIEEDIRFSKAMPPVKIKCDKLIQLVRYREFQKRRLKEKEAIREKLRNMPPPKELRTFRESAKDSLNGKDGVNPRDIIDSKDLINANEFQHVKNILDSKDTKYCKEIFSGESSVSKDASHFKLLRTKELVHQDPLHSRDASYHKEFSHPKETFSCKELSYSRDTLHKDLLNPRELSHCKDLVNSKEPRFMKSSHTKITYSKEVLRSKELLKERYLRDCSKMKFKLPQDPHLDFDKEQNQNVQKIDEQVEVNKTMSAPKNPSKELPKKSEKITVMMYLVLERRIFTGERKEDKAF